jgi:hypothetical protein
MSYDTRDQSVEDANPLLLFQFLQGSTYYRYCLASETTVLAVEGHTWTPAVMVPSEFGQSNDIGKDAIKIELAADCPLALTFSGSTPDAVTTLTVFRTFTGPEETPIYYWKGHVNSVGIEAGKVILNCDPIFTRLQRPGLRAMDGKMCRHVLYGRGCNVDSLTYKTSYPQAGPTYIIRGVSGAVVTLPSDTARDGYWDGGFLTYVPSGASRMIMTHKASKLILIRPIPEMITAFAAHPETGVQVDIFRGCDRTYAMCKERFNNPGNFGGDPFFAQSNPFSTSVSFVR